MQNNWTYYLEKCLLLVIHRDVGFDAPYTYAKLVCSPKSRTLQSSAKYFFPCYYTAYISSAVLQSFLRSSFTTHPRIFKAAASARLTGAYAPVFF